MTTDVHEDTLDAAFAEMRGQDMKVSDDLMNRIMLDADNTLANAAPVAQRPRPSLGAMLLDVIGGWPSFSGLAAATVAGVWIGAVQPAALTNLSSGLWGDTIEVPVLEADILASWEG